MNDHIKKNKNLILGVVFLVIFLVWLFSYNTFDEQEKVVEVKVIDVTEKYLVVELNSEYDNCDVSMPEGISDLSEFSKGDIVSVTYNGGIRDSNPPGLDGVSKIVLVKKGAYHNEN